MKTSDFPARIDLDSGMLLRFFEVADADAVATSVAECLEHLRPWMPWADAKSADPEFQRDRLAKLPGLAERGEEWQYGIFPADGTRMLGSFGLMTRRGPRTLEIGYWLHESVTGQGHATRAAGALTDVALGITDVDRVLICCDEANARSAAIPRRLGYTLLRTEKRRPEAPGERGRLMVWSLARDMRDAKK
jgi:RimJ/RimL family protein N-acetyltransferase